MNAAVKEFTPGISQRPVNRTDDDSWQGILLRSRIAARSLIILADELAAILYMPPAR